MADHEYLLCWGDVDVLQLALETGFDPNALSTAGVLPLHRVAMRGDAKKAALLLAFGADINAVNRYGISALMFACRNGKSEVAKLLIQRGARLDDVDYRGTTSLEWALQSDDPEIAQVLVTAGARWTLAALALLDMTYSGHWRLLDHGPWPVRDAPPAVAAYVKAHSNLQGICARVIRRHRLPTDALPARLARAVRWGNV